MAERYNPPVPIWIEGIGEMAGRKLSAEKTVELKKVAAERLKGRGDRAAQEVLEEVAKEFDVTANTVRYHLAKADVNGAPRQERAAKPGRRGPGRPAKQGRGRPRLRKARKGTGRTRRTSSASGQDGSASVEVQSLRNKARNLRQLALVSLKKAKALEQAAKVLQRIG